MRPAHDGAAVADLIIEFIDIFSSLKGEPCLVKSAEEATITIRRILRNVNCKQAVLGGIPSHIKQTVLAALQNVAHTEIEKIPSSHVLNVISRADVGITWAEYASAKQGALVEIADDDSVRLSSTLPPTHIVLVPSRNVLPDVSQAMEEAARIIRGSPPGKKPIVTFISGPSKTADIEMKLLYGVHGPLSVHAILLEWV